MKKTIALLLAVMLCLGLFAACQSSSLEAYNASATDVSGDAADAETATTDYTPCFESYKPDEVMLTVNGIDITWRELFYWYYYDVSSIQYYAGEITDWEDTSLFNGEQTIRDYITNNGLETVKHYAALESKAAEMGVELTAEDNADIETRWNDNVANYGEGDEQAFIEYLQTLFLDKELYNHINEISALYDRLLTETYGEGGSKLTEEELLAGAEDLGYYRAKHIFLSLTDADGAALTDEQKAAKKAQLQTILDELKTITDPAKIEAKIDEYTASISEDTGKDYYTDGYTFQLNGSLDDNFEAAAAAVGVNELNPEIVESSMGYHIVMRLPLTTTAVVEYSSETEFTTLADIVPSGMFEALVDDWAAEATVEYSKAYNKLDVEKVFSKAKTTGGAADSSDGIAWYIIVIIVLLVAVVAVGVILIVQHEKASRAAEAAAAAEREGKPADEAAEEESGETPEAEAPEESSQPEAEEKSTGEAPEDKSEE